jgi:hypothetical protein
MTAGRRLLVCGLVCAACIPAAPASAAKLPLPPSESGRAGAVAPGGGERLVTRGDGDTTLVLALRRGDRRVLRSRRIDGRWRVAPVAFDGATTGLSANGRVLVLARPTRAFPPTETRLAVLDSHSLVVRREIALPGFFTMDAISPDGRWVYLIQYAGQDVLDYRVRALDTSKGRLAARDVVDPREPEEQMGGLPMTRAMSRDGRWAYTLYGGGEETFIHALDTVGRTAACIDLDMLLPGSDLTGYRLRVSADGGQIRVREGAAGLVATVDTRTFAVSEPGEAHSAAADRPGEERAAPAPTAEASRFPWPGLAAAAILAGLCGLAVAARPARWRRAP